MRALLDREWRDQLAREGVALPPRARGPVDASLNAAAGDAQDGATDDEPPCPACGCAQPLVDGACADCGLQLA